MTRGEHTGGDAMAGRDVVLAKLENLVAEFRDGAEDWENVTIDQFLEAFGGLLGDIEGAYVNRGVALPPNAWQIVADALEGARYYE